jgi:raffinose/stachyose/melibiose transport system substrate-binding protein
MKHAKKILTALMTVIVSLALAQAVFAGGKTDSGSSAGGKVTILYIDWTTPNNPSDKPVYDRMAKFADDNGFTLIHENVLGDELKAAIRTDVASNSVADIFLFWGNPGNASSLLEASVIVPFDQYLNVSKETKIDLFPKDVVGLTTVNGVISTITTGLSNYVWVCNKEIFDRYGQKYPTTLEEMIAVGKVFNENGITPLAMASSGGNPAHEWVAELLGQLPNADKDLEEINKNYNFDTPNIRRTLETIETMRKNNLLPKDTIALGDWKLDAAFYDQGKAAMAYLLATYQLTEISAETGKKSVIIPAPRMPGGTRDTTQYCRMGGDMGPMISTKAWNDPKKKDIVIKFADFLYSKEMMELRLYSQGEIPSRTDVNVDASKVKMALVPEIIAWSKGKTSFSNFPTACPKSEIWTSFADGFDNLLAGKQTPAEIIRSINTALARVKD